jgi:hypothetical protein
MLNLIKWDLYGFVKGKRLLTYLLVIVVTTLIFVGISFVTDVPDGLTALSESAAFFSSVLVFFCPIFAGMTIAQAFEDRLIQAAIMSGKSRLAIVFVKTLFFTLAIFIYLLVATAMSTCILSALKGWGEDDIGITVGALIIRLAGFLLLSAVGYSVVVPFVFYSKRIGGSIGLGFVVSLLLYSLTQELAKNPDLHSALQLTPLGRSFFIMGGEGFRYGLATVLVIAVWMTAYIFLSWLLIRKEELK